MNSTSATAQAQPQEGQVGNNESATEQAQPQEGAILKINYEINIIAAIALLMSASSLIWQGINYYNGAKIQLMRPEQIVIANSKSARYPNRDGGPYVHFIVTLSYVNTGAAGYNATVQSERIFIKGEGMSFEEKWYRYVHSDADDTDSTRLKVKDESEAKPIPLVAGSSVSHETLFQPWEKLCSRSNRSCDSRANYVDWQSFIEWFKPKRTLEVEIRADIYGRSEPLSVTCKVVMEERHVDNLISRGWASPICR